MRGLSGFFIMAAFAALFSVSPTQARQPSAIVEVVTFRLKSGVTIEQFTNADRVIERRVVGRRAGFLKRESVPGEDGQWLVIVHWRSAKDAQASMDAFAASPDTKDFMAMIDLDTFVMKRYGR
jgi:hypothetical protein